MLIPHNGRRTKFTLFIILIRHCIVIVYIAYNYTNNHMMYQVTIVYSHRDVGEL